MKFVRELDLRQSCLLSGFRGWSQSRLYFAPSLDLVSRFWCFLCLYFCCNTSGFMYHPYLLLRSCSMHPLSLSLIWMMTQAAFLDMNRQKERERDDNNNNRKEDPWDFHVRSRVHLKREVEPQTPNIGRSSVLLDPSLLRFACSLDTMSQVSLVPNSILVSWTVNENMRTHFVTAVMYLHDEVTGIHEHGKQSWTTRGKMLNP
jgi:uncharacterized membrane protein YhdT